VNSHVHDPPGITTEEPELTVGMADKRKRKGAGLKKEIEGMNPVKVSGTPGAADTVLCWGSNAVACREAGRELGLRIVQPLVLSPFPEESFARALEGSGKLIVVEVNEEGDLACLVRQFGYRPDSLVLKYDGRPFFAEELADRLREVTA
jgi:2-oxoglutarate ferredoxin oxidoreductase subunit alpha